MFIAITEVYQRIDYEANTVLNEISVCAKMDQSTNNHVYVVYESFSICMHIAI